MSKGKQRTENNRSGKGPGRGQAVLLPAVILAALLALLFFIVYKHATYEPEPVQTPPATETPAPVTETPATPSPSPTPTPSDEPVATDPALPPEETVPAEPVGQQGEQGTAA